MVELIKLHVCPKMVVSSVLNRVIADSHATQLSLDGADGSKWMKTLPSLSVHGLKKRQPVDGACGRHWHGERNQR